MNNKTKALCEAAIMVAMSLILGFLSLGRLPDGGSINIAMLPLVFFAVRHGAGWGALAGLVSGTLDYILGNGIAIDWTTIICDYMIAFAMVGLGAGLFKGGKKSAIWGTLVGGALQFASSYLVGVFVWGKWMPDVFWGMAMTSPWIYSFLYNISWAGPNIVLTLVVFAVLYRVAPIRRYLLSEDLRA